MSEKVINIWKNIIETSNTSKLEKIIHKEAIFYSPVVYFPQHGKEKVLKYLYSAINIFKGKQFKYTKNKFYGAKVFCAEFNARFNDIEVNGIDIIKCDKELIKEFKVFLRPIKAVEVVWNEMKNKLDEYDNNLS